MKGIGYKAPRDDRLGELVDNGRYEIGGASIQKPIDHRELDIVVAGGHNNFLSTDYDSHKSMFRLS